MQLLTQDINIVMLTLCLHEFLKLHYPIMHCIISQFVFSNSLRKITKHSLHKDIFDAWGFLRLLNLL